MIPISMCIQFQFHYTNPFKECNLFRGLIAQNIVTHDQPIILNKERTLDLCE